MAASFGWGDMTDILSQHARSRLMAAVRQRDTKPEVRVRSLIHRMGGRFSLHRKDLPGTPDIVLPKRRLAVFVHGCFWHGHDCNKGRPPKTRQEYWVPKIGANKSRDKRKERELNALGWRVETVWQCELDDLARLTARLEALLAAPPSARKH